MVERHDGGLKTPVFGVYRPYKCLIRLKLHFRLIRGSIAVVVLARV
jgi:hypothetical protein